MLLDDELPGLTYLKLLCEQLSDLEVVKAFNKPEVFLKEVGDLNFDFAIIDIEMPGVNGLQVAKSLGTKPVIFSTAYKEFAADAFDLNAIDYVMKPIKKERLQQAISKVKNYLNSKPKEKSILQFNTDQGKTLINIDQLVYIKVSEIDSRDKVAFLEDGSQFIFKNISFEKLQNLLPSDEFVRINKGEMIAIQIVRSFSFNEVTTTLKLSPDEPLKLSLSEAYREEFSKKHSS